MDSTLYSIILGIVQGIAEFLPISSSAHLVVTSSFLNNNEPLSLAQNIGLHVGTLLSVLIFFRKDWINLIIKLLKRLRGQSSFESDVFFPSLIVGSIPAGIIGILFQDKIEEYLHHPLVVTVPLALVGWAMWYGDKKLPTNKSLQDITLKQAFFVGICQACALIPGVSRSGSTILGGRFLGLDRGEAARFSFMLGTPAMAGAALLNGKEIIASLTQSDFYVGCITATIVGCLSIKFLLGFLKNNGFFSFLIYRVVLAIIILIVFWPHS